MGLGRCHQLHEAARESEHTHIKGKPEIVVKVHCRHGVDAANAQLMGALSSYVREQCRFHSCVNQGRRSDLVLKLSFRVEFQPQELQHCPSLQ